MCCPGTRREQHGGGLPVRARQGPLQRGPPRARVLPQAGVGAVGEQGAHRLGVPPAGGAAQRGPLGAVPALRVRRGPGRQQRPDDVGGAVHGGRVQGRGALGVGCRRVGPGPQQRPDFRGLAEHRRQDEALGQLLAASFGHARRG
ncbi:hypothetical protein GCM10027168_67030 [Streptomyces capparidis]